MNNRGNQMRVVTKALLKKIAACDDGTKYAVKSLLGKSYSDAIRQCIADDQLQWANWGIVRVMDGTERVKYAIYAAKQVLKIFEDKYPNDKRPREAINAVERWVNAPNEKNNADAANAANEAYAAANDTYADANAANAAADVRIKMLKYGILLLDKQNKDKTND